MSELDRLGIPHTIESPFILLYDNHSSHYDFELFEWCSQHNIIIITLYPNSTHILQPLDVGVFGAFKTKWTKELRSWKFENKNKSIRETDFVKILKRATDKAFKQETIINAFRATGAYPWDSSNIKLDRCLGASKVATSASETREESSTQLSIESVTAAEMTEESPTETGESPEETQEASTETQELSTETAETPTNAPAEPQTDAAITQDADGSTHMSAIDVQSLLESIKESCLLLETHYNSVDDHEKALSMSLMKQQVTFFKSAAAIPSGPKSMDQILTSPAEFKRSGIRNFKLKNHGIMNSEEMLAKGREIRDQKNKIEEEKTKKREMAQKIRNMKKEKAEEAKINPKKRGRPSKKVPIQEDSEDDFIPLKRTRNVKK